jgi:hypothetical protein
VASAPVNWKQTFSTAMRLPGLPVFAPKERNVYRFTLLWTDRSVGGDVQASWDIALTERNRTSWNNAYKMPLLRSNDR